MTVESTNARPASGISRRRLVQGAAWATPAVLIATAAPAFAASPNVTFTNLTFTTTVNGSNTYLRWSFTPNGIALTELTLTLTFPLLAHEGLSQTRGATPTVSPAANQPATNSAILLYGAIAAGTAVSGRIKVPSLPTGTYSASITSAKESDGDTVPVIAINTFTV